MSVHECRGDGFTHFDSDDCNGGTSDLKEIFKLLPKFRSGRELTVSYDKTGYWYAGYPNLDGDYSCDLYATDRDIEGACLNLLSQIDKFNHTRSN